MIRTFTKEQLIEAFTAAPKAIQDALSGGDLIDFIVGLQNNYNLHVDTAGTVSDMIRNTLLGIMDPGEFFSGLIELGIPADTAKKLTNDLNTKIFVPLHKEVLGGTTQTGLHAETPNYAQAANTPVSQITQSESAATPVPDAAPVPAQKIPVPTYVMPPTKPIEPVTAPAFQPVVSQAAPISMPKPEPAREPIPSAQSPISVPTHEPTILAQPAVQTPPVAPSQKDAAREALGNAMKQYGIDPYREPVDDANP